MENEFRKAVFTDVDGTLLDGFITIDFVEYLRSKNLFNEVYYAQQKVLMAEFRKGRISFDAWLEEWATIWGKGVEDQSTKKILEASKAFFPFFQSRIFPESKDLIGLFHQHGYLVVGVSVGVVEAINLVKDYLGLDEVIASRTEVIDDKYTGKILTDYHKPNGKKKAILKFAKDYSIDLEKSFGIGDQLLDCQIFDLTTKNVALNPDVHLMKYAKNKNFLVANHTNILSKIQTLL